MKDGGILSTMTYYGSQMVVENYNIMRPVKAHVPFWPYLLPIHRVPFS